MSKPSRTPHDLRPPKVSTTSQKPVNLGTLGETNIQRSVGKSGL